MDFSAALVVIKDGGLVQRKAWHEETYIKLQGDSVVLFFKDCELMPFTIATQSLTADDWHMVKPVDVGLEPSNSGRALYGDEVVPLHANKET